MLEINCSLFCLYFLFFVQNILRDDYIIEKQKIALNDKTKFSFIFIMYIIYYYE